MDGFDYGPDGPKRVATCHADGCGNAHVALVVPADGSAVVCGPCGQPITDLTPNPQEAP